MYALDSRQLTPDNVQALAHLHLSVATYAAYYVTLEVVVSLLFWGVGLLIFWRKSDEGIGLFVSLLLVLFGGTGVTDYFLAAYAPAQSPLLLQILLDLINTVQWSGLVAFCLTFPTGRFVPRWSWLLVLLTALSVIIYPTFFLGLAPALNSPVASAAVFLLLIGSTLFIVIYRYVRIFDAVQRQQSKWFVYPVAINISVGLIGGTMLTAVVPIASPYQLLSATLGLFPLAFIPLGVGIAILRYRLWDIDVIINCTLVYGMLTAGIVGMYILIVGGLGTLMQAQGSPALSLVATALAAILFQPLRLFLQRAVNRLMYGERDNPYHVISRLGQRLETTLAPEAVLPLIVETVAQALKLPYVAISLMQGEELIIAASYGKPMETTLTLPLVYQMETIGQMLLAPRARGDSFTPADRRLLDDLAPGGDSRSCCSAHHRTATSTGATCYCTRGGTPPLAT